MVEAQADIALGEAFGPAALAHAKVFRGGPSMYILPALAFAGAIILSSLFSLFLPLISLRLQGYASLLWIVFAFVGLVAAMRILSRQQVRGFLDGLRSLGTPAAFPTRFKFDEQGMAIHSDRACYHAPWEAVLFVIPSAEHWLVQVDTSTVAVPFRAFTDPAAEQAFVDLVTQSISDVARDRSVLARQ